VNTAQRVFLHWFILAQFIDLVPLVLVNGDESAWVINTARAATTHFIAHL